MAEPYPSFVCPLTQELMHDPVMTVDGLTYERSAIEAHFQTCTHLFGCPIDTRLIPNCALRSAIQSWSSQHPVKRHALPVPTFAVNAVQRAYGRDVEVEADDAAEEPGVRLVWLASDKVHDLHLWSTVQKKFRFAQSMQINTEGLPYTQLVFSVPSNAKIARILNRERKKKIENDYRVMFLVEKETGFNRQITLTAWNSVHSGGNITEALDACRQFILSKI